MLVRIFFSFSCFLVVASETSTLSFDKLDVTKNIMKNFFRMSSIAHFSAALELLAKLMQVTPFVSKVFGEKHNGTTLAMYLVKSDCARFTPVMIITQLK